MRKSIKQLPTKAIQNSRIYYIVYIDMDFLRLMNRKYRYKVIWFLIEWIHVTIHLVELSPVGRIANIRINEIANNIPEIEVINIIPFIWIQITFLHDLFIILNKSTSLFFRREWECLTIDDHFRSFTRASSEPWVPSCVDRYT